ncbi:MAG: L-serine ammonia-lyase, iron-sulfur-dependent, subunit alpha [Desulfobacterales bacterium]|nr:MAG: L-serine ammonia-lyase, iron-sulfur-dependent, subunit alpha [Desulfobacterales bacterium]
MKAPSIFNDVIGPVMRGPSSSHSAASVRIGHIARALMSDEIEDVLVEFDEAGSLPTTHESQGSDMGLCGGLLGFATSDERLLNYKHELQHAGIKIRYVSGNYGDPHPNTYRLTLKNSSETHSMIAVSTGGGMIKVCEIDGHAVSIGGDLNETLVYFNDDEQPVIAEIENAISNAAPSVKKGGTKNFIHLQTHAPLSAEKLASLQAVKNVIAVKSIFPVLPVPSPPKTAIPFSSCHEMLAYNRKKSMSLGELAVQYESGRGAISPDEVYRKMIDIVGVIRKSIRQGLKGTSYTDRILGCQSRRFKQCLQSGSLLEAGLMNRAILYVTSLMEVKSSLGIIVAAPTAGSCGALPGTILAAAEAVDCSERDTAAALLAAGVIGVFIADSATFAAEVGGCQAECGSGSGMAAAALVQLMGGSAETAVAAASMALQNSFGMVCDPVANRVEVPCLGKNVMAAANAIACANMAMAGFDPVIPFDEVVAAMNDVGQTIPSELRCTALGGLSVTKTSQKIKEKLDKILP